jgi:probable H4MPT-linked C1 transfer pathway protein
MTGELADIFENRQAGVAQILTCFNQYSAPENNYVFADKQGWLKPNDATFHWQDVASKNWLASANFAANHIENGLFIDIGSTTSDIIPIKNANPVTDGIDDFQRQRSRELLYMGAIRTPLIALTNTAPVNGHVISLAAEVFATTADCWVLLDEIDTSLIQDISADGTSWDKHNCARRLARLLGTDADIPASTQWTQLAHWFTEQQIHQITNACLIVLSNHVDLPSDAPVIGAGIGRFIAKRCAERLNRPFVDFSHLTTPSLSSAADHAPAVAVALLAQQQFA